MPRHEVPKKIYHTALGIINCVGLGMQTNLRLSIYSVHLVKTCMFEGVCFFVNNSNQEGMFLFMKLYLENGCITHFFSKGHQIGRNFFVIPAS